MPAYKPGTPKEVIIKDGWARGFRPRQIYAEVKQQGYEISIDELMPYFCQFEKEMREFIGPEAVKEFRAYKTLWRTIED